MFRLFAVLALTALVSPALADVTLTVSNPSKENQVIVKKVFPTRVVCELVRDRMLETSFGFQLTVTCS